MVHRRLKQSGLPSDKTLQTLVRGALPNDVRRQIPTLCRGHFVRLHQNVVALGPAASGKTHLLCAVGRELIARGFTVLFVPVHHLLDRLLLAEQALDLERELRRLDACDAVLIDDIGYVQQDREEMEVLFTFLSERYERRSVMITSNLVFSQWDRIFKDAMTTACAIDRLVHHSIILELTGESHRSDAAKKANPAAATAASEAAT
jgi:DNA replication protein DnaC